MEQISYKPAPAVEPIDSLPFIVHQKRGKDRVWSNWKVEPIDDYVDACVLGNEYATHYLQFILDNPFYVGSSLLGSIATDIDFADDTCAKGYYVGFFSTLEKVLHSGAKQFDIWKQLEDSQEWNRKFQRQRKEENEAQQKVGKANAAIDGVKLC